MLATTIQITNNPPHTPTPKKQNPRPDAQATTVTGGRSHGVEREPDSVSARKNNFMPNPNTHPHPPPTLRAVNTCEHKKTTNTPTTGTLIVPHKTGLPRKEVIQPHLPVRLPCYDFTPLTLHTFGASPLAVGPATSGADDSGGVTGGVYKARERIHRGMLIRDY